jgi:hypothetical protein
MVESIIPTEVSSINESRLIISSSSNEMLYSGKITAGRGMPVRGWE